MPNIGLYWCLARIIAYFQTREYYSFQEKFNYLAVHVGTKWRIAYFTQNKAMPSHIRNNLRNGPCT